MCESLWKEMREGRLPDIGCDKCQNGYIRHSKPDGHLGFVFEECACLVEYESLKETISLWKQSNIGGKLITRYKFEDWDEPEQEGLTFDTLLSLIDAEEGRNWLFLYGGTGSGKTYSAIIAAQIAMLREKSVFFVNTAELLDGLRPGSENDEMSLRDIYMAKAKKSDVLILDDIGHEKSSEWVREKLFLIVNDRWNKGKMTIFTSNYDLERVKTSVSPAVYSRIKGESLEINLSTRQDRRIIE